MEEAEARRVKAEVEGAMGEIEDIMADIQENMDAVETVEYNIYTAIMNGYMGKISQAREIVYT